MIYSSFLQDVTVNAAGSFVAGLALIVLIERQLKLRQALDERRRRDVERNDRRRAALRSLHTELKSNAATVTLSLESLSAGRVPFPLFDTAGMNLAFEPAVYETLPDSTAEALLQVRSRLESANELHRLVFDMDQGGTSVLAGLLAASGGTQPLMASTHAAFRKDRERLREALLSRCRNVAEPLYHAIDVVEADLAITGLPPASKRTFRHEGTESIE